MAEDVPPPGALARADIAGPSRSQPVHAQLIDGPITILRGHIPLVGEMAAGALRYYTADGAEAEIRLQPGILRVERRQITVLTSSLIRRGDSRIASTTGRSDDETGG